jgi:hypothetical protein
MLSLERYFQAPAGLSQIVHQAVTSKPCLYACRSGARTRLRSCLVASKLFGSRDLEFPPVELHCSSITPLPGSPPGLYVTGSPWNRFRLGRLTWLAVVLLSRLTLLNQLAKRDPKRLSNTHLLHRWAGHCLGLTGSPRDRLEQPHDRPPLRD